MAKGPESKTPSDAVEILRRRYIAGRPEREISLCEERANAEIAQMIYDVRKKAGLTQEELAARIGSTKSVISRLEDADYEGHSLGMLRRIAEALELRVSLRFEAAGEVVARAARRVAAVPAGRSRRVDSRMGGVAKCAKARATAKVSCGGKATGKTTVAKKG